MSEYEYVRIADIISHGPELKTYVFDRDFSPKPGQFGGIWLPGVDAKPFSFSSSNAMTIQKRGPFTEKLFEKKAGESLHVSRPRGHGFPEGRYTIFGGGCGIAPLKMLTQTEGYCVELAVVASRTADLVPFLGYWEKTGAVVYTEDGSAGSKGIITDFEWSQLPDTLYATCGPELMMKGVLDAIGKPERTHLSLERRMKCMGGGCGECAISGYTVCIDGPVFDGVKVRDMPHFGKVGRDRTGKLVPLKRC